MTYAPIEGVCPVCHQDSERQLPKGWHHDEVVQLRQQVTLLRFAITVTCCDPDGRVCIRGSDEDREILQSALDATEPKL